MSSTFRSIFTNKLFLKNHEQEGKNCITFRDILSPKQLTSENTTTSPNLFLKTLIICSYIADWNWFAAELAICPFVNENTKVFIVLNWIPETCNTENPIPNPIFSEGIREISIGNLEKTKRNIFLLHPALVGGLMHVKLTIAQFCSKNNCDDINKEDSASTNYPVFTRVVIGSANLTLDDWCNLRQGFFIAEGERNDHQENTNKNINVHHQQQQFGKEIEDVLLWLSLPKSLVFETLQLSTFSWMNIPEKTRLIFSVPSTLQNAIDKIEKKRNRETSVSQDGEVNKKEDDENNDDEDCDDDGLPPLDAPGMNTQRSRKMLSRGNRNIHEKRAEFYSEYLPVSFELNKRYIPPIEVLRSCVVSVSQQQQQQQVTHENIIQLKQIAYQASSVGGVSDRLLEYFIAATNPSLSFPPITSQTSSKSNSLENNEVEAQSEEKNRRQEQERNVIRSSTILTPFPSVSSVIHHAASDGFCGAITLRYFQLVGTKLHLTGWRAMMANRLDECCEEGIPLTCHTKLIYPIDESRDRRNNSSSWLVLGSHNFTADCWAFAKQFLPKNFELSVFIPIASKQNHDDDENIFKLFPIQTTFENDSSNSNRFVFLNHKRDFFSALKHSEAKLKARSRRVAEKLMEGVNFDLDENLLMQIFVEGLEYHYSKFQNEVHDDFGRH